MTAQIWTVASLGYLVMFGCFWLGWFVRGKLDQKIRRTLAELLADKIAAQHVARVKDLELQGR